jgi:hypothetical protein
MVLSSITAIALFAIGFDVVQLLATVGVTNLVIFFIVRKAVKRRLSNA